MRSFGMCAVAALAAGSPAAIGQVIEWNNAGGGQWSVAGSWLQGNVPDAAGETALIALPGTYTITLSGSTSPGSVELQNPLATLQIANAAALNITESGITNHGLIRIGNGAGFSFTPVRYQVSGVLAGTGVLRLDAGTSLDSAYLEASGAVGFISHQSPHTIAGSGRLYGPMTNSSVIRADAPGRILECRGTLTQAGSGFIHCTTGIFGLGNSALLSGGSISGPGTWQASNSSTIGNVVVESNGVVLNNSTLRVRGAGLMNHATIDVNNGAGPSFTYIRAETPTTLDGTGAVNLRSNTSLDTAVIDADAGGSIVHEASHSITGSGRIYAPMTNLGTIRATIPGRLLEIRATVAQVGNGRVIGDNADAAISTGAVVTGGRFESIGTGRVRVNSTATVSGVQNLGSMQVDNNSTLQLLAGGLDNDGTLAVNDGIGLNLTQIRAQENAAINGNGSIVLNAAANLDTAYISAAADVTIENGVDHAIRGTGRIYAPMSNLGAIRADNPTGPLEIRSAINQSLTARLVGQNAVLQLANGSSISGGYLASIGSGVVRTSGTARVSGVTNEGTVEVFNNSTLDVDSGGIVNNSQIVVNPTKGINFTQIRASSDCTLGGNGSVHLDAAASNADTAYISSFANATITNAAGHTIAGNGNVYAPLINRGVLRGSATDTDALLRLRGPVTQIGGFVTADKGSVGLQGTALTGGTFNATLAGGVIRSVGSDSSVTDTVSFCPLHIDNNSSVALINFTNNSIIYVNPAAGGNFTFARFPGTQSLLGNGIVRLNAAASLDTAYLSGPNGADRVAFAPGQSVLGRGNIYGNFTIAGLLSPGQTTDTIDTIGIRSGEVILAPSATLNLQAFGGDPGQYDVINGTGTLRLAGTANVKLINYTLNTTCDEIPFIQGPMIFGTFDTVNLEVPPATLGRSWRLWYKSNGVSLRLTCPADYNADCNVDDLDFQSFARWYNILDCNDPTMPGDCPGDLNRDDIVDDVDFQLFVLAYNDVLCP